MTSVKCDRHGRSPVDKYFCITSGWPPPGKLMHNEIIPIVIMWPIMQHNFTSESFICIILLLPGKVKVNRSNFTTDHVI